MRQASLVTLVAAVGILGCRYRANVVPLSGVPEEIATLAGRWEGEYASDITRRSGNITFEITARVDSAFGDVRMFPPTGSVGFPIPLDKREAHLLHAPSPQFLSIRFVAVGRGRVSGELESYTAPDCDCPVHTTFIGQVRGNRISGTYTTRGEAIRDQVGTWWVLRIKP